MPSDTKDKSEPPAPEVLKPQDENVSAASDSHILPSSQGKSKMNARFRRATYRPSHKATFIGLGVVIIILAANAAVIAFFINSQSQTNVGTTQGEVTISSDVLDKLGVSRNTIDSQGTELVIGLNSRFGGTLTVAGNTSFAGQLNLNGKLSANNVGIVKLEAGETALGQLNVNGDGTISNLNLREDLSVVGQTSLQGSVAISQLLTVNNNANIVGNLAVGGTLSVRSFQASSLVSDTSLTIGGHVLTRGSAPSISSGPALGNNGTVSISGNDASGTVAVNIGTGGGGGVLAYVSFVNQYTNIPHVVVSMIGAGATGSHYIYRSTTGFTIGINGSLPPGGYAFDYIVMQ